MNYGRGGGGGGTTFLSYLVKVCKFIWPLFKKCCHGNIMNDILIKATANNDPLVNIKSQKDLALYCLTFRHNGRKPPGPRTPYHLRLNHQMLTLKGLGGSF